MKLIIEPTHIPDLVIVRRDVARDARGYFVEQFRADVFAAARLPSAFAQVNESQSRFGTVRGLHFQWDPPQGKLMRVVHGRAFLVAVDIRPGSPTLGQWHGIELDGGPDTQVWAPAGFARGFAALSDECTIQYMCTGAYNAATEGSIRWDDPAIGITWPIFGPILSGKDEDAPTLDAWLARPESERFRYRATEAA